MKKIYTHGGFLVESTLESIPQSIIQMVYMVTTDRATFINSISILLSVISMGSKGFMLSYSIDRTTFIFNMMCFVADLFK